MLTLLANGVQKKWKLFWLKIFSCRLRQKGRRREKVGNIMKTSKSWPLEVDDIFQCWRSLQSLHLKKTEKKTAYTDMVCKLK